jgi:putative oxidoreductase
MTSTRIDTAALLLRVTLGAVLLAHGLLKFLVFTLPGAAGFFESVGFPGWTAYVVAPVEVLAGVALIAGFHARLVALASLPVLLGSLSVHLGNGWLFSNPNGGWEFPAVLVVLAAAVALLGDGAYGMRRIGTAAAPRLATAR